MSTERVIVATNALPPINMRSRNIYLCAVNLELWHFRNIRYPNTRDILISAKDGTRWVIASVSTTTVESWDMGRMGYGLRMAEGEEVDRGPEQGEQFYWEPAGDSEDDNSQYIPVHQS